MSDGDGGEDAEDRRVIGELFMLSGELTTRVGW